MSCHKTIVGIDASNIRAGGGLTHLREVISAVTPGKRTFAALLVWSSRQTLDQLPDHTWLRKNEVTTSRSWFRYWWWQKNILYHEFHENCCNVLFVPGGVCVVKGFPIVSLSQNLLPFQTRESRRFSARSRVRYYLLRILQASTFSRSAGVIFLTNYARDVVRSCIKGLLPETTVIAHGICDSFRSPPRHSEKVGQVTNQKPFRWLYVSTVSEYKHQWNVVRAVAALQQTHAVSLDLVGPAEPNALRRLRLELRKVDPDGRFVRYLGAIAHERLPEVYRSADGFVFASSCENLPIILLEAMAAGLPVACSASGPMPEILGDNGVYFTPDDPWSIRIALARIMANPDLSSRIAQGAFEKAQDYTWAKCAQETFQFIVGTGTGY